MQLFSFGGSILWLELDQNYILCLYVFLRIFFFGEKLPNECKSD
jgi:hypothetical protein